MYITERAIKFWSFKSLIGSKKQLSFQALILIELLQRKKDLIVHRLGAQFGVYKTT